MEGDLINNISVKFRGAAEDVGCPGDESISGKSN
jgi:hypothetical protein